MSAVNWHWVCLDDDDLGLIEDGPEPGVEGDEITTQDLWDWVLAVQEAVLESLETS